MSNENQTSPSTSPKKPPLKTTPLWWRIIKGGALIGLIGALVAPIVLAIAIGVAYPNLPSVDELKNYKPHMAMQIFTEDGQLIGEFGPERRKPTSFKDTPAHLKQAILAIEDARFYEHHGVDYYGLARAILNNILHPGEPQGASTITQQLAKNFFFTNERTLSRKFYEALMSVKIENNLTKEEILERYMNHIYLGERAYGFAAAADIYFGKELKELTIAESAMLAALPQAPSANNPIRNRVNADSRQQYILVRMRDLKMITPAEYAQAKSEVVGVVDTKATIANQGYDIHAEYVAEMARILMFDRYKDAAYTGGLKVYTTINSVEQTAAYNGVRNATINYDKRNAYRGPEAFYALPIKPEEHTKIIDKALKQHKDYDELRSAFVTSVSATGLKAMLSDGSPIEINGAGFIGAQKSAVGKKNAIKVGSIIRVVEIDASASWRIVQAPEVQASFVSMSSVDGSIRALVGGFDFNYSSFNHITQAWRQPGSGIKPFIYSAAMEKNGMTPDSIVDDSEITVGSWSPKNSDGQYLGQITLAQALAGSRNMVSIRLLQSIGNDYFRQYATRFGFDAKRIDQYLTVALGATEVTSWQMVGGYGVFANGGYKVNPYIISKVVDRDNNVILQAQPKKSGDASIRVITEKNAKMTDALMRGAVQHGTARAAMALGRSDLAGKTGTTNDAKDAWFNGYHPKLVGIAWMGFDKPKTLGEGEFGGTLALPIWMNYMKVALNKQKTEDRQDYAEAVSTGTTATGNKVKKAPEKLNADGSVIPPSGSEARKSTENVNSTDAKAAKEASKPDPLAPFVLKPTVEKAPNPAKP